MTYFYSFIFSLIINLFSQYSFAGIPEKKCTKVDYSSRFGPTRDQDGHGYCWAFAASALVEENLCKADKKNCGNSISTLDISRCSWRLLSVSEGWITGESLKCATSSGVCTEKLAPYSNLSSMRCSLWDMIGVESSIKCNHKELADIYDNWKKNENCNRVSNTSILAVSQLATGIRGELIRSLQSKVPEQALTGKEAIDLLAGSSSKSDYLKKLLIPRACAQNRKKVSGEIVEKSVDPESTVEKKQEILDFITEGLKNNSSVAIGLDLGRTGTFNEFLYGKKSNHSIVVTGMRYHNGQCEFQLKNSWGAGADFNGWYPVDELKDAIYSGLYLK